MDAEEDLTTTPLWLSHHHPPQYERCVRIGRRHVCRRCLVLYPVALLVAAASFSADLAAADLWVLALLPLPTVIEWWLEHLGRIEYAAGRQTATTVLAAIALGRGFARYLDNPADLAFWAMVLIYGGSCAAIALWRFLDEHAP